MQIALDSPPEEIRPGLSCSAKIVTATRQNVLSIPLQALTVRKKIDLETPKEGVMAATVAPNDKSMNQEIQGVFVVHNGQAEFHRVDTGITGATDIEVLSGVNEGDQIITGSYKVIRTLRNDARVKVDNRAPSISDSKS